MLKTQTIFYVIFNDKAGYYNRSKSGFTKKLKSAQFFKTEKGVVDALENIIEYYSYFSSKTIEIDQQNTYVIELVIGSEKTIKIKPEHENMELFNENI